MTNRANHHSEGAGQLALHPYGNVSHGFTLIELLVVIAIIALLVSILLPSLNRAQELAKRAVCSTNVRQIGTVMHMYAGDYEGRYPRENVVTIATCCYSLGVDFRPQLNPYADNAGLFYCPSGGRLTPEGGTWHTTDSPTADHGWDDPNPVRYRWMAYEIWPSDDVLGPYFSYVGPQHDTPREDDVVEAAEEVIVQDLAMTDIGRAWPGFLNHPSATNEYYKIVEPSPGMGFNVGFHDGHVSWTDILDAKILATYGGMIAFR